MNITKTKHKNLVFVAAAFGLFLLLCIISRPLLVHADNVVIGYTSKQTLQPGLVVAIDSAKDRSVKLAPADNTNLIFGVVVDPSDAPITLESQNEKYFVATSGTYQVLVSTSNGAIKAGDYISMSTTNGVAGRALSNQPIMLGKAQSAFNGSSNVISTANGVKIGRIYISIGVAKNPLANSDPTLPGFLRRVANSVANHAVPVVRVYTALVIFLISLVAAIVILWSGVRSSLISLGRNPLSRHAIFSGMYKVVFTGLGVFLIGLAGVYLLLKV